MSNSRNLLCSIEHISFFAVTQFYLQTKYSQEIRTLIYTTNPIETFNRGIRKVTKNRAIFPNEDALTKPLYLAVQDMSNR
ncbi:MAG: transposase [Spirochaetales bacterium]|nr:transposase [Spirochaetales bacterium]